MIDVITHVMGCLIIGMQFNKETTARRSAEARVSNYNCFRMKSCKTNGQPVCGYDEDSATIAKFENECALFTVNCNGRGHDLFKIVDDTICEKKVVPKTTTPTTITSPTIDYYYDLRPETEPDTSTHYWQDPLMLAQRITRGYVEDGRLLRNDDDTHYFPTNMMTLLMRQ